MAVTMPEGDSFSRSFCSAAMIVSFLSVHIIPHNPTSKGVNSLQGMAHRPKQQQTWQVSPKITKGAGQNDNFTAFPLVKQQHIIPVAEYKQQVQPSEISLTWD
jgi:hypothetical protein